MDFDRFTGDSRKSQSALELLTVYSWALLVIGVLLAIAFIVALSNNQANYLSPTCTIQPLLPCSDSLLSTTPIKYYITFTNDLQIPMNFTANAINVTTEGIGSSGTEHSFGYCYPGFALPGTSVVCTANVSGSYGATSGRQAGVFFTLSYYLCNSDSQSSCNTASSYKTSGLSLQTIEPATLSYNTLTVEIGSIGNGAIGDNGLLVIDGERYADGANVLLPYGKYTVYAQPLAGFTFSSWSIKQGSSTISPALPANAVGSLTFNSASEIAVIFTGLSCNVCSFLVACPAVCPTEVSCGGGLNKCT